MARHPIGFKPSWPRLLYKPGEALRDEPTGPVADLVGEEMITPLDDWESPDSDDDDD